MKFQTILRTLWLATGFAAVLSLAGQAQAQEITNSEFDDGQYVVPFAQPVSAQDTSAPASTPVTSERQAFQAAATISAPSISERANLMRIAVLERWVTAAEARPTQSSFRPQPSSFHPQRLSGLSEVANRNQGLRRLRLFSRTSAIPSDCAENYTLGPRGSPSEKLY